MELSCKTLDCNPFPRGRTLKYFNLLFLMSIPMDSRTTHKLWKVTFFYLVWFVVCVLLERKCLEQMNNYGIYCDYTREHTQTLFWFVRIPTLNPKARIEEALLALHNLHFSTSQAHSWKQPPCTQQTSRRESQMEYFLTLINCHAKHRVRADKNK